MKKNHRRRYLVDGKYQWGQALAVILGHTGAVLITGSLLSWFYLIMKSGVAVNHNRLFPFYLGGCLVAVLLLTVFFSFRRSRSMAGMIHKIHNILNDADNGVYPEEGIDFRRSDYFGSISGPLNACLNRMKENEAILRSINVLLKDIQNRANDPDYLKVQLELILRKANQKGVSR